MGTMLLVLMLWLPPLAATLVAIMRRPYTPRVGWTTLALGAIPLASAVWLAALALDPSRGVTAPADAWSVDALSALFALCVAFVSLLASALGPGLEADNPDPASARRFRIFSNAFAATMLLAVTTHNVATMWVAIEATTIVSAIAIPLERSKPSVEASWKYLLICSVGIALALAGTILAYFDFVATAGHVPGALDWTVLRRAAPSLHRELMQLAFAFILVGYGTKAGLAPMHTWMPDAYAEAPSPITAMMSGVLVAVAMYAIARWKAVVDAAMLPAFTSALLLAIGLISIGIGAFSLVVQRHYKRMLAYSSIEHMGLVSVGLALGPLGIFAALLHLVNHAVAKSMAFLLAGRILRRYKSTELAGVSGLLRAMPWTGPLFAIGVLALVGLPPFGLFLSEFLLLRAAVVNGHFVAAAVVLVLLLTAFISLVGHLNRMLYGSVPDGVATGEPREWHVMALGACAAILVVLGVVLPPPLKILIDHSVAALMPASLIP
jgi:hydrogenase-4 component F